MIWAARRLWDVGVVAASTHLKNETKVAVWVLWIPTWPLHHQTLNSFCSVFFKHTSSRTFSLLSLSLKLQSSHCPPPNHSFKSGRGRRWWPRPHPSCGGWCRLLPTPTSSTKLSERWVLSPILLVGKGGVLMIKALCSFFCWKVDKCMARLQELQFTASGGAKSIDVVNLCPRSSRGYLRSSLRCKQDSFRWASYCRNNSFSWTNFLPALFLFFSRRRVNTI